MIILWPINTFLWIFTFWTMFCIGSNFHNKAHFPWAVDDGEAGEADEAVWAPWRMVIQ